MPHVWKDEPSLEFQQKAEGEKDSLTCPLCAAYSLIILSAHSVPFSEVEQEKKTENHG